MKIIVTLLSICCSVQLYAMSNAFTLYTKLDMTNNLVVNMGHCTNALDGANKQYVDGITNAFYSTFAAKSYVHSYVDSIYSHPNARWVNKSSTASKTNGMFNTPYVSIFDAVTNAPDGGIVFVMPGTYIERWNDVDSGGVGYVLEKSLTIKGFDKNKTTLVNVGTRGMIYCNSASASLFLYGMTITSSNILTGVGGALYFVNVSKVVVENCIFESCFASNAAGQAIGGAIRSRITEDVVVRNCEFRNCSVNLGNGGATAYVTNIYNSLFVNCRAGFGGAVYGSRSVYDCVIQDCYALFDGGGLYGGSVGESICYLSTIENCISGRSGGSSSGFDLKLCNIKAIGPSPFDSNTGGFQTVYVIGCTTNNGFVAETYWP